MLDMDRRAKQSGIKSNLLELGKSFIYSLLWVGAAYGMMRTRLNANTAEIHEVRTNLSSHIQIDGDRYISRSEFDTYVNGIDKRFDDVDTKLDIIIRALDK